MIPYAEREAAARASFAAGNHRVATSPAPHGQKYAPGTRVRIADDLGPSMSHFPSGLAATVEYTYAHAYGGKGREARQYSLNVDGHGSVAWYYEGQLSAENKGQNMTAFDEAFTRCIGVEGHFSNDPNDSGGATCWGITEAVARANGYAGSMKDLPIDDAKLIYRKRYWIPLGLDFISTSMPALAAELFDSGINVGITRSGAWLQRALNGLNNGGTLYADIDVDGSVGNATIRALDALHARRGAAAEVVLRRLCDSQQGAYYLDLALGQQKDEAFLFGWVQNRVGGA